MHTIRQFTGLKTRRAPRLPCPTSAFTLIELILVMTILTIAVSITAPALAHFFRGRTLDSEARRLLALTRQGQSRAVSEGLPMELWIDATKGTYGLEAEPTYEQMDPKQVEVTLDSEMQIEVMNLNGPTTAATSASNVGTTSDSSMAMRLPNNHPNLPKIRFLPDGTITETSPQQFRVVGRDQSSVTLLLARNRLNYEIRTRSNQ
jgi:prepilin-type N-terminal cleavage/methylation domain-containing protein